MCSVVITSNSNPPFCNRTLLLSSSLDEHRRITFFKYTSLFFLIRKTTALPENEGKSAGCWLRVATISFLASCTSSLNIAQT
jgi:hypothetical protein